MGEAKTVLLGFHLQGNPPFWEAAIASEPLREEPAIPDSVGELLTVARGMPAPFMIAASNWQWLSAQHEHASSFDRLRDAVFAGTAQPVVCHGNGAHAAYLSPDELWEELSGNKQTLERLLGIPEKKRPVFPETLCLERAGLPLYEQIADSIFYPESDSASAFEPKRFGAVTAWPVWQGHHESLDLLMGQPAEVQVDADEVAKRYAEALERFFQRLPAGASVSVWYPVTAESPAAYFEVVRQAWKRVLRSGTNIVLALSEPAPQRRPELTFEQSGRLGGAPQVTPLIARDGRYEAAGEESPFDAFSSPAIYRRHPFILWESGVPWISLLNVFVERLELTDRVGAQAWYEKDGAGQLPASPRFLLRYLKSAKLWMAGTDIQNITKMGLASSMLIRVIRDVLLRDQAVSTVFGKFSVTQTVDAKFDVVRASLGYLLDNGINAIEFAQRQEAASPADEGFLRAVREHRLRASESLTRAQAASRVTGQTPGAWFRVVDMLDVFIRELTAAASLADSAWRALGRRKSLALEYLAQIYPPQVPVLLDRTGITAFQPDHALPPESRSSTP